MAQTIMPSVLTDEQINKFSSGGLTDEQLGQLEVQSQPKSRSVFKTVGGFLGDVTGVIGLAKGFGEAGKIAKAGLTGKPIPAPSISPAQFAGSAGKAGLTAATFATGGLAGGIRGAVGVAARTGEMGLTGAAFQALSNIEAKEKATQGLGGATAIGAAIPFGGAALGGAKRLFGKTLQGIGEKAQTVLIKPSRADLADGFNIRNINKYNLQGNLSEMLEKTESKIQGLAKSLSGKIRGTDASIDLNEMYAKTINKLTQNKAANFGEIQAIKRVSEVLKAEIDHLSPSGLVDLAQAQLVKQGAGKKGSWVFGSADPDAKGIEKIYTSFYRELKEEIEKKASSGVRELNKQISDLIPIQNALVRRIPVADRNEFLSLSDIGTAALSLLEPAAATLFIAKKTLQSGKVASKLARFGQGLQEKVVPRTKIGERIFGR